MMSMELKRITSKGIGSNITKMRMNLIQTIFSECFLALTLSVEETYTEDLSNSATINNKTREASLIIRNKEPFLVS